MMSHTAPFVTTHQSDQNRATWTTKPISAGLLSNPPTPLPLKAVPHLCASGGHFLQEGYATAG